MLFNSYEFLFFYLPATLFGFFALSGLRRVRTAAAWLALASIFFYGYWSPRYVVLLMTSIVLNFGAGRLILAERNGSVPGRAKRVLVASIAANLLALCYFKYANFFVDSINAVTHAGLSIERIVLPIGISFFTFTQIAFLVDTYQGKVRESRFVPYTLFVTFYPHLIAGPVLHHAEMMPQFAREATYRFNLENFLIGSAFLLIGLFKKIVLADGIQPFVAPAFDASPTYALSGIEAWGGVLAYTLQLYFDFSGYSDMAIGLSKMLNVDLPLNFDSPYKAHDISDFWRRWHMTLSRFLRDYLYIPLGGNRHGATRRYANLMTTMVLGGLWHGAGWTFVIWGLLHGLYLVVHQFWQMLAVRVFGRDGISRAWSARVLSVGLTFLAVVVAWVFFRATSLDAALRVLAGMAGLNGWALPIEWRATLGTVPLATYSHLDAFGGVRQLAWICVLLAIVWSVPNSQEIVAAARRRIGAWRRENLAWAALGGMAVLLFVLAAVNGSRGSSEFIYFNF